MNFTNKYKSLALSLSILSFSSFAQSNGEENITLIGHHYNDDYLFVLNPTWEDVEGSWGTSQYHLGWDSSDQTLSGRTAGVSQEVEFIPRELRIYGTVGCGYVDLNYTDQAPWKVTGNFCLDFHIDEEFNTELEMKDWIEELVVTETAIEFPEPTRKDIAEFLKKLIEF